MPNESSSDFAEVTAREQRNGDKIFARYTLTEIFGRADGNAYA